jgi:hypothetical protein
VDESPVRAFQLKRAECNVQAGAESLGIPAAETGPAGAPALKSGSGPHCAGALREGGTASAARPICSFGLIEPENLGIHPCAPTHPAW